MSTWTNDWAIAINQDALAQGATRIDGVSNAEPLVARPGDEDGKAREYMPMAVAECGGEPEKQKWLNNTPAVGFISNPSTLMCLNVKGCGTEIIYDGCVVRGVTCGTTRAGFVRSSARVTSPLIGSPHALLLAYVNILPRRKYPNERWTLSASGQLRSALTPKLCATVNSGRTVTLTKCVLPVPKSQLWNYDSQSQQLTNTDGLCVTAAKSTPSPSPAAKKETMVLGKPLAGRAPGQATGTDLSAPRSFAILFLNNKLDAAKVTCNQTCLSRLGMRPGAGHYYSVQDVWTRSTLMTVGAGQNITVDVPANGGSVYLRADPVASV